MSYDPTFNLSIPSADISMAASSVFESDGFAVSSMLLPSRFGELTGQAELGVNGNTFNISRQSASKDIHAALLQLWAHELVASTGDSIVVVRQARTSIGVSVLDVPHSQLGGDAQWVTLDCMPTHAC